MKLIIILLCLGIDRFTPLGQWVRNYGWLKGYFKYHQQYLGSTPFGKHTFGLLTALVPAIIVIGLLQWIFAYCAWPIPEFLLGALALFYSLGTISNMPLFSGPSQSASIEDAARQQGAITPAKQDNVLWQAQTQIFAVLFWFVLLGAVGAVLYRFSRILAERSQTVDLPIEGLQGPAQCWINLLDWLPVRLLGLCIALAGRFEQTFKIWWTQILVHPKENQVYLNACVQEALEPGKADVQALSSLFQRVLAIVLAIFALMVLVALWHSPTQLR